MLQLLLCYNSYYVTTPIMLQLLLKYVTTPTTSNSSLKTHGAAAPHTQITWRLC